MKAFMLISFFFVTLLTLPAYSNESSLESPEIELEEDLALDEDLRTQLEDEEVGTGSTVGNGMPIKTQIDDTTI